MSWGNPRGNILQISRRMPGKGLAAHRNDAAALSVVTVSPVSQDHFLKIFADHVDIIHCVLDAGVRLKNYRRQYINQGTHRVVGAMAFHGILTA